MSFERAAVTTLAWTGAGVVAGLPLLAVSAGDASMALATIRLSGLVAFGIALAVRLARLADGSWFRAVPEWWCRWMTGAWAVVLVTGAVGLVAVTTSPALRYDPSMQYLQVLSAVDIAWATAALAVGLRWWRSPRAAGIGVAVLAVVVSGRSGATSMSSDSARVDPGLWMPNGCSSSSCPTTSPLR